MYYLFKKRFISLDDDNEFSNTQFQDLCTEKQNNQRLMQIKTDLEKEIQEHANNTKQNMQNDELDGLNERLRSYENEISQLQKDCLNIKSISENELEDERTKSCKLL